MLDLKVTVATERGRVSVLISSVNFTMFMLYFFI